MRPAPTKKSIVGITFSTFDLLHAGHVKMLEEAKQECDYLIVGLQLDPSLERPEKTNLFKPSLNATFKLVHANM